LTLTACVQSIGLPNNTLSSENKIKCPELTPLIFPMAEGDFINSYAKLEDLYNLCKVKESSLIDYIGK
jgi:hypothetical protein